MPKPVIHNRVLAIQASIKRQAEQERKQRAARAAVRVLAIQHGVVRGRQYHRALTKKGFSLQMVLHGEEAVRAILAKQYDLILVEAYNDNWAPLCLKLVREYLSLRDVPIVLLTSQVGEFTPEACREHGIARLFDPHQQSPADIVRCCEKLTGIVPARPAWQFPNAEALAA